jgi:hypothetical protein
LRDASVPEMRKLFANYDSSANPPLGASAAWAQWASAHMNEVLGLPAHWPGRGKCQEQENVEARRLISEAEARAERLRETAEELRTGRIHPVHAANRILKIANEISQPKALHKEQFK